MSKDSKAIYFPGLNGIRAWAASVVIFIHFNEFSYLFGMKNFYPESDLGGIAVTVFFVLSGFLITYLLLTERNRFQTISITQFYIRRILRIWPLYYAILLLCMLAYAVLPVPDSLWIKIFLFFIFFLITLGVTAHSYLYFELRFIKGKRQFTRIISGNSYSQNQIKI